MKRMINLNDHRIKEENRVISRKKRKPDDTDTIVAKQAPVVNSALFFQYNTQLGIIIFLIDKLALWLHDFQNFLNF